MGTEFDGDRWSRGINFMGIVCLGGQEVGDRKSGDQIGSGPNESQPMIESVSFHSEPLNFSFQNEHFL